ncbi:MAG: DUF4815 domain-containing protein [Pseudomonadota bacterium]|nr:DUF4815 domain-containing protein [Pseudomonadota bacterium]
MAGLKTFPQSPYFDDYDQSKDFLKVLFRPGYGVQVREMNQMQTILQNQIGRMADSFFENGARVVRGEASVGNNFTYITLTSALARTVDQYVNLTITNAAGVAAHIIKVVPITGSDATTVYLQYTKSTITSNSFGVNDVLSITHTDTTIETTTVASFGTGALFTIDSGVYYINGEFVNVDSATIVLSKYAPLTISDISVGFILVDNVITPDMDSSLLDNATGTTNASAPGAHRYSLSTTLTIKPTDATLLASYIEISRVIDGKIATASNSGDYTVFNKLLAARTFDEAGNYTVNGFDISVNEHLQSSTQAGVYTSAQGGDDAKMVYTIESGRAYVSGFQVETFTKTNLTVPKARTTASIINGALSLPYQAFITVTPTGTSVAITIGQIITIKAGATTIGTAIARMVTVNPDTTINVHVSGYTLTSSSTPTSIVSSGGFTGNYISTTINGKTSLCVFKTPESYVKTVTSSVYEYQFSQQVTNNASAISVTCSDAISSNLTDYTVVYVKAGVIHVVNPDAISVSGNTANLTVNALTSNGTVTVFGKATRAYSAPRTKTLVTVTNEAVVAANNTLTLANSDIVSITSVKQGSITGALVDSLFNFDNGQRDTIYDFGSLTSKGSVVTGTYYVSYSYYSHGAGDFFSSQSYGTDYEVIPSYTTSNGDVIFLGSAIDFRMSKSAGGTDYQTNSATSFANGSVMIVSFDYYLPRKDLVCINSVGNLSVVSGIPALNPALPQVPDNALALYNVLVNPFTFSYKDCVVTDTKSRRYTMSDIGTLDNRLDTLEYYTTLNQAEKDIIDKNYVNTFKSGFIVDNFSTQSVADETSPELNCAFDLTKQECRPQTPSKFIPLQMTSSSGIVSNSGIATLAFTEVASVVQSICSDVERIQPYIQFNFDGNIVLTPAVDSWVSTEFMPDFFFDAGTLNVTTGALATAGSALDTFYDATIASTGRQVDVTNGNTVTTQRNVGVTNTKVGSVLKSTGVSAFMRGQTITVTGSGFKPNTRLYVTFDGVSVDQFTTNTAGGVLSSSGSGTINFVFTIPSSGSILFRTGAKTLVVSDVPVGSASNATTIANAIYTATGLINNIQNQFNQTRLVADVASVTFADSGSNSGTDSGTGGDAGGDDPLAESFIVPNAAGMFVTSIDLFFGLEAATNTFPVTVELRNMVNGYPGKDIAAKAFMPASSLVGSANGSIATKFTFPYPVFLNGGSEYAFVVKTDSQVLNIWTSVLGNRAYKSTDGSVATGEIISKQVYLGSMFRSQNDRTWTAEQTRDVKFNINRAVFQASGSLNAANLLHTYDNADNAYNQYLVDVLKFTTGSYTVVVNHPNHGFKTGDSVTFTSNTNATSIAGIPITQIFSVPLTVTATSMDVYTFTTTTPATSSIIAGGAMYATSKVQYAESIIASSDISVIGTTLGYSLSTKDFVTGLSSGQTTRNANSVVKHPTLQISGASGDSSIQSTITFATTSNYLSPVVDLQALGVNAINNRADADGLSQYVQKPISLLTPANRFTTYISANVPNSANLVVYYRVGQDSIQSSTWNVATLVSGTKTSSTTDYTEWEFSNSFAADFYTIQVKVVMVTTNPAQIPRLSSVRTVSVKAV